MATGIGQKTPGCIFFVHRVDLWDFVSFIAFRGEYDEWYVIS